MELSAVPPTRNGEGSTPGSDLAPSMTEIEFDTRKYRRSAFIPDYRETMFPEIPDEPQYTHEIPFAPQSAAASTRHSVWSAEPQKDHNNSKTNGYSTAPSRRNSVAPIFAKKAAAEASDTASSVWRYSSSPSKTDLTNGQSNGNGPRRTSTAPIFAQKAAAAAGAEIDTASTRRNSQSPGPVLKSRSGLVYGHATWHDADGPMLSPTGEGDQSSAASFKTARENGAPASRRYSDGAGLTSKTNFHSNAVQEPMPQQQPNGAYSRLSRRYSDLSALNGGHHSPRNVSPVDSRRSVAPQFSRSGAVSPITTYRSNSPLDSRPRNGTTASAGPSALVSPITTRPNGGFSGAVSLRSGSPGTATSQIQAPTSSSTTLGTSPLARNSMAPPPSSSTTTLTTTNHPAPLQKLSLNTRLPQPAAPPANKSPTPSEAEEEMDEVIALSPAGRAPLQNFRRSRSSLLLSAEGPAASTSSLNPLVEEGAGKQYFGQDVQMDDLVAVNLENAFERL